ncbi:sugar ABC transporter permease [uncultured Treponema sp.]|uniref:carbohydrate ABC transporter permease n=1 Tax=uncultured Treponema sp. TaxID=162155 RepID=UPI0025DA0C1D|nr:sugar ABC transporter permease [uncultured Treponema sp.]
MKTKFFLKRQQLWGFIFIAPWLIGFLVFYAGPMVVSLIYSFLDYNLIQPELTKFVGIGNWRRAILEDKQILMSIYRILEYTIISLPLSLVFSLFAAVLLNNKYLLGKKLFRALYYIPTMVPLVATVIIWKGILNEQTGWVNLMIKGTVGGEGLRWLASTKLVYISYAFIGLWGVGNTIVILLAGLQGIPQSLYEASYIDGANGWQRMTRITIPMITPILFYNIITGVVGMMQYFLVPMVINQGSGYPEGMTNFPMVLFYRHAFSYFNMGYAAVIAWFIFVLGLIFTLILFGTSKGWVFYADSKN